MKSISKISFCILLGMSASPIFLANAAVASSYPNLHVAESARSSYEGFIGGGKDPFENLVTGYSEAYLSEIESEINPAQLDSLNQRTVEQSSENRSYISDISGTRDEQRKAIYEQSFGDDGEFDPVAYAEMYSIFATSEREKTVSHIGDGLVNLVGIMDENNTALIDLSRNVSELTSQATVNLVDALNNRSHDSKVAMFDGFQQSMGNVSEMSVQAESTILLASSFSDDCGGACSFPEIPPIFVSDPQEPPVAVTPTPVIPDYDRCFDNKFDWKYDKFIYYKCP